MATTTSGKSHRRSPGKLLTRLRGFAVSERGAVTSWFALLLVPMLGFTFGAIKFSQLAEQRAGMIDAMDAAALAMARQFEFDDLDPCVIAEGKTQVAKDARAEVVRYAREFFAKSYPEHSYLFRDAELNEPLDVTQDLFFDLTCSQVRVYTTAFSDMGGVLGRYFGIGSVPLHLKSEISLPGAGRVEVALVLDVTGSMSSCPTTSGGSCSESRMDVLKDAVEDMMDEFYGEADGAENDFVKVGIVPFAQSVNVNPAHFFRDGYGNVSSLGKAWMDTEAKAFWHGSNFMHLTYDEGRAAESDADEWFEIDPDRKVNHFHLFNSLGRSHAAWKGCVEARPFPLDELAVAPGENFTQSDYNAARSKPSDLNVPSGTSSATTSRIDEAWTGIPDHSPRMSMSDLTGADNTRFVPWFAPDEPDCDGNDGKCDYWSDPGQQRRFAVNANDSGFPNWIIDGPKSDAGHYISEYENRDFVPDWRYLNVNDGQVPASHVYRNFMLHYRTVYARRFADDGTPVTYSEAVAGGRCGTSSFTFPYKSSSADGMMWAIDKFDAYMCTNREYRLRQAYVGWWDAASKTYKGKYEFDTGYGSSSDNLTTGKAASRGPNNRCVAPIVPLTTTKKTVMDAVKALQPAGSTNTAIGAIWGWRLLSHKAPFVEAANPAEPEGRRWRKTMVLMTDGQNNMPSKWSHNLSRYTPYGYMVEDRLNVNTSGNTNPDQVDNKYEYEFDQKTIRICHRMRSAGIKVYTIGFAISSGSDVEKMLKACAVDEDSFYLAKDAGELKEAFGHITDQIVELHVSG